MIDETLAHVHASPLRERLVLRGSLLTERWVPGRRAQDIDFLVDGSWTPESLTPRVQETFATMRGVAVEVITIWAETDFPGVRARLQRGEAAVQVDFGWGELLAAPPSVLEVRGLPWRAVSAEVMFGWKAHSLVEHGPRGRWHAKTVADLVLLLRHVKLDLPVAKKAIELAFESQRLPLSTFDAMFDDPTWGQSRGSRNKWKSYVKKSPWVTFTLAEALAEVKAALVSLSLRSGERAG
ncbi:MAG: nucleotidyl transferase AbiEii/AbiGii toxin family protein [Archangium sp.]|nr:nucleotidyl transferase AbiEii/AbiGii toxin family protein [Archangium sp.]